MCHRHRVRASWPASILLACLLAAPAAQALAVDPAPPTSSTPGQPVPKDTLDAIEAQFAPAKQPTSREEAIKMLIEQMEQAVSLGKAAETWYPDAPNLYVVRNLMLSAALELAAQDRTEARQLLVAQIADRIMDAPAPAPEKLRADFFLLREKIVHDRQLVEPSTAPAAPAPVQPIPAELAEAARADIRAFLARYQATSVLPRSVAYAVVLTELAELGELKTELLDRIEKDFSNVEDLAPFLRHYGRGRFSAKLTRLNGKPLAVPDDVKAKVIVIDFWATWCGPCVAEAPRMKRVYDQFHRRGVEFVGISLDEDPGAKDRVEQFIKRQGLGWIHTLSGQGWSDPTVKLYGIDAIPALWVIDPSGRIISTNARENLEQILEDALARPAAPAPKPRS